jgi:putative ABC transport system permease protein
LTNKDSQAVGHQIEGVGGVVPSVSRQYQLFYGNKNWMTTIQGATPEFVAVRNFNVEIGRFFSTQEVDTRMRVAVLGKILLIICFARFILLDRRCGFILLPLL